MQALMSIWVSFVMFFVNFIPGFVVPPKEEVPDKSYPYVFVHGFMGWGRDEGINSDIAYWGATACDIVENINKAGYECYSASVGPLSSNWDRACELYAQLTGTRVDYGEAHSQKHSHRRYGRNYAEPLIEGWGEKDENGLTNKINLIGHSFGGNTVRLLQGLLSKGSEEERKVTAENDISPLFLGGKDDYINSITTVATPNNGTTLYYLADEHHLTEFLTFFVYSYAGFFGRSLINGYFDFHLEQFGLTNVPGEEPSELTFFEAVSVMMDNWEDTAMYDLSPEGVKKLNDFLELEDNTYYFSYPFNSTTKIDSTGTYVATPNTLVVLRPFAAMIGAYPENKITDFEIDESWLPNDGLVNVKSALYPFDDPHKDYDANNIEKGMWNVMPLSLGDHGNAIGIGVSEELTMEMYLGLVEMIESLPVTS